MASAPASVWAYALHDVVEQARIAVFLGLLEQLSRLGAVGRLVEIHPRRRQRADEPIRFLLGADPDVNLAALGVLALEANENVLVDFQQLLQAFDGGGPVLHR